MNRYSLFFLCILLTFQNFFIKLHAMSEQNKQCVEYILSQEIIKTENSELFYQEARKFIDSREKSYQTLSRKELKKFKAILEIFRKDATFANNMPIQNIKEIEKLENELTKAIVFKEKVKARVKTTPKKIYVPNETDNSQLVSSIQTLLQAQLKNEQLLKIVFAAQCITLVLSAPAIKAYKKIISKFRKQKQSDT